MKYTVKQSATLLEIVLEIFKGTSRQKARQKISHSEILVDGNKITRNAKQLIGPGSVVELVPLESTKLATQKPNRKNPVVIYFEDEYLIAGLKPAGILSCESEDEAVDKTYHKILENFLSEREKDRVRLYVIHRLDREVEGLIIFAKSRSTMKKVKDDWQLASKRYLALTENKPEPVEGIIENWISDTPTHKVFTTNQEVPGSKFAKSSYSCLRQAGKYHLVEVTLFTGRKNQIRVHLAGIGCPIVGDRKYGANDKIHRQIRLAAYHLELPHPKTSRMIVLDYKPSSRFFTPSEDMDERYKIL
jgi:23S rRNA pseudouridine1911/1915/1917 synthase